MTTPARNFLRLILPESGLKACCVILKNRATGKARTRHRWTASVDDLARIIFEEDAATVGADEFLSVYHACAAFSRQERQQVAAIGAQSLWLDVDAGEGKPYADAVEAAEALATFARKTGLPAPLMVGSGHGLHAYWPLVEMLPAPEWQGYAEGLKRLCRDEGFRTGPERTADIASVLRTPGTMNRKNGNAPVQVGPLVGPYPLEMFGRLKDDQRTNGSRTAGASAPHAPVSLSERLAAALAEGDRFDAFAEPIAEQCAQIRHFRDSGGNLPEPEWYAALGVMAFCEDGDEFGHRWSSGFAGYSEAETSERLARARGLSGATRCARFADLAPERCRACPLFGKLVSPISLGRKEDGSVGSLDAVGGAAAHVSDPHKNHEPVHAYPDLPTDFAWGAHGELMFKGEGKKTEIVISKHPLYLDTIQRAEVQQDSFSFAFRQWLPLEGWIDIVIPAKRLMGGEGISEMFARGASIQDRDLFKRYVVAAVDAYHEKEYLLTKFEQFGWKDDESAFLWGRSLYTAEGVESVVGSDELKTRSQFLQMRPGGSLARWTAAADQLFAVECEPQAFALLASFAAPLMRFHATDEGGAVVSLVSPQSGSGKTTALAAVASVWGRYDGLALNNFDTRVAKGITLGVLGNLPAVYDEIANRDPEVLREFVLTFTNGRDRMRGSAEGAIRHVAHRWQTILVTAANRSIVELVRGTDTTDAPGFRILEFETSLPASLGKGRGDDLRHDLEVNSGWAGDAYLRYITAPQAVGWLRIAVKKHTEAIWQATGLRHEHRFWVRTIGSVSVAAAIVRKLGLINFSPERILSWAIMQAKRQSDDAPVTGRFGGETVVTTLSEYLNDVIGDTLVVNTPYKAHQKAVVLSQKPKRVLVRYETETRRYLLAERPFREWMNARNIPGGYIVTELFKLDVVTRKRVSATLSAGTDIPGGQVNCIEVNGAHVLLAGTIADPLKVVGMNERVA